MTEFAEPAAAGGENVDRREVAYYEQLAETWWDQVGPFWPLHRLNELRTAWLRQVLARVYARDPQESQPLRNVSLLDVGCGGGILSESVAILGAQVHGIDVVGKNVEAARRHARDASLRVRYEKTTAVVLSQRGLKFDVVLNMEVLEHVPNPQALLSDCARLVRPGGVLVLATINRTFLSWLFAIVGAEYVLRWLPRGTHRWRQFLTPGELERGLDANGFVVIDKTGVRVNPLTRRFSLTPIMAVNYMLVAQRIDT